TFVQIRTTSPGLIGKSKNVTLSVGGIDRVWKVENLASWPAGTLRAFTREIAGVTVYSEPFRVTIANNATFSVSGGNVKYRSCNNTSCTDDPDDNHWKTSDLHGKGT